MIEYKLYPLEPFWNTEKHEKNITKMAKDGWRPILMGLTEGSMTGSPLILFEKETGGFEEL